MNRLDHNLKQLLPRLEVALGRLETALASLGRARFLVMAVAFAMAYSVCFYAPKLKLYLGEPADGTFEWSRGITFMQQSEAPLDLSAVREPAMRWRVLPALVAHWLPMEARMAAYLIPWLGVATLFAHVGATILRITGSRTVSLLVLCNMGGTAAINGCTTNLGINDAWTLLGLNVVVFSPSAWAVVAAGVLTPWVDERFLIALPLALACRHFFVRAIRIDWELVGFGTGVALYLGTRLWWEMEHKAAVSGQFVHDQWHGFQATWRWTFVGWWMGFRVAWVFVLLPLLVRVQGSFGGSRFFLTGGVVAAIAAITLLASDVSRNTQLLMPLLALGAILLLRDGGAKLASLWLALVLVGNSLIPFVAVTYNKTWPIVPLPLELLIWLKG